MCAISIVSRVIRQVFLLNCTSCMQSYNTTNLGALTSGNIIVLKISQSINRITASISEHIFLA